MYRLILLTLLLGCVSSAFAYGTVSGTVTEVRVDADGKGMVFFSQTIVGAPPSCVHSAYTNAFAFNSNTAGGRSVLAVALAAKATGDTISVVGAGTCVIFGNAWVEDWQYGNLQ
jgi:hypothetical protein